MPHATTARPALTAWDIEFAAFVMLVGMATTATPYRATVESSNAARHYAYQNGDRKPAPRETNIRRNARLFFDA